MLWVLNMSNPVDEVMRDFANKSLHKAVHDHKMAEEWKKIQEMDDTDKLSEILIRLRGWNY